MRIQFASIAWFASPLHCAEPNSLVHVDHTSTQLPWHPRQTSPSHHIASWVEQIHVRGTQCVARRSALTVSERACHALLVLTRKAQLRDPVQNHLWKWIGINPDWIRIGRMRIQCERAQTGFNPVQCALGVQCEQALRWDLFRLKSGQVVKNRTQGCNYYFWTEVSIMIDSTCTCINMCNYALITLSYSAYMYVHVMCYSL